MMCKVAVCVLVTGFFTSILPAQVQPTAIQVAGKTYQVLYQNETADQGYIMATLQDAIGVQGTALFVLRTNSTAATLYLNSGDKYLWTTTTTTTNLTKLLTPPSGGSDQVITPTNKTLIKAATAGDTIPLVATAGAPVSVDILIIYTAAAAAAVGGTSNILDKARLAVAEANQSYVDSSVFVTLNLVGIEPVNYTEGPNLQTDLGRLYIPGDGFLDAVPTLRDNYRADLVCLFNSSPDPNYAGMAYLGYVGTTKELGYSVVQAIYAVGHYVLAHEVGHNFGCNHDRANAYGGGAYSYSFGYNFYANTLPWGTIMSYPGIRLGLFSSPDKTFLGAPVGTATENNARSINEHASAIADYYPTPTFTTKIVKNGTGTILCNGTNAPASITLGRGQVLNLAAQGNFLCWSGAQTTPATNLQLTINQSITVTANFADGSTPLAPVVTLQPLSQNLMSGATLRLTAGGVGIPTPSFKWVKDGTELGTPGTSLTISNVSITNQGTYTCSLSNSAGTISSAQALIVVGSAPQFAQQPVSQLVQLGGSATFSVIMDSDGLTYQWFFNDAPIPAATSRTYTLWNVQAPKMGNYYVQVTRSGATVQSATAQLILASPPAITQQPQRVAITRGQSAAFSVAGVGLSPITYQWQFNAVNLPNQTNTTLALSSVQTNQAGSYRVQVSNPNGITTSTNVTLVVYNPLTILQQPSAITAAKGTTPIFSMFASGSAPVTYQWYCNDVALTNQVYNTCRLKVVQTTNAGTYYVIVQNPSGQLQSSNATLTVLDPPVITVQPQALAADEGSTATFSVQASGAVPMTFQWSRNGTAIPGGTSSNLVLSGISPSHAGNYVAAITNADGGVISYSVALTVNVHPTITLQPSAASASAGNTASFFMAASGVSPLSFAWFFNGQPIGGNFDTLNLSNVQTNQAGAYYVVVSNRLGSCTSISANLTVYDPPRITGPTTLSADEGTNATIAPTISGKGPMTFSWALNSQTIAGPTASSLTLSNVTSASAGYYTLTAINSDGTATSPTIFLNVFALPRITTQPTSVLSPNGGSVSFLVAGSGGTPLGVQWFKGTNAVSGATNTTFSLPVVALADEGSYKVIFSNRLGTAASTNVNLAISYPPQITQQPAAATIVQGNPVSFTVAATGRTPMTYAWQLNSVAITGATNATYTIASVAVGHSGDYGVMVRNADGAVWAPAARLTVVTLPIITSQPSDTTVPIGQAATLSATVSSPVTPTYQWSFNGTPLSGTTASTLTLISVQASQAGSYQLTVGNAAGNVLSRIATVTVKDPPVFTVQPANASVQFGDTLQLSATATSSKTPIAYQWWKSAVLLAGRTQAQLTIANVEATVAGAYRLQATNVDGIAYSSYGTVTFQTQPPVITTDLPTTLTIAPAATLQLAVTVTGRATLAYVWKQNGTVLASQTSSTLTIANVRTNEAGAYQISITNPDGTAVSTSCYVTVLALPPNINVQPMSVIKVRGSTTTFTVGCVNPIGITYQWFKSGVALAWKTNSTLTVTNVQDADVAAYNAVAANQYGSTASSTANLQLLSAPTITADIQDALVSLGDSVTFAVAVTAQGAVGYQWKFNGSNTGANANMFSLYNLGANLAGSYSVRITNEAGSCTSRTATLTIRQPPVFTLLPASLYRKPGDTAVFSASATGRGTLAYQWFWQSNPLPGQTQNSLLLTNVQLATAGSYFVNVANADGSTNSLVATLAVDNPPVITVQPADVALSGANRYATLSVTATSLTALAYQWQFSGTNLTGATGSTLIINSATAAQEGGYQVVVQNPLGSTNSRTATVRVPQPPVITVQPADCTALLGSTQTLVVAATGRATLTFQWQRQGSNLAGQTNSTLTMSNIKNSDLAGYTAVVSNSDGSATSRQATISMSPGQPVAPAIIVQPLDTQAIKGANATFSVQVTGTTPLAYQWQFKGANIPSQTQSNLVLTAVDETDIGYYAVLVTNALGAATSSNANFTLLYLPAILSQPTTASVVQGGNLSLSVSVSNATAFYWKLNGNLILYTNQPQLSLANVQSSAAGSYTLTCSNAIGGIISQPITVTILTPPTIATQPMGMYLIKGTTATLSVGPFGTGPLYYQWFFGSSPILWGTQPSLTLTNVQTINEGYYSVTISNLCGSVTSVQVPITVRNPAVITTQPVATRALNQGAALAISVVATGRTPLTYIWKKDGATIASATTATLAIASAQGSDAGTYTVQVGNFDGVDNSTPCVVTVCVAPYFASTCMTIAPPKGAGITLGSNMGGTTPMTYQWRLNGSNLTAATNSSITITNIQTFQEGTYSIAVANAAGSITQNIAIVTVNDPPVITQQPVSTNAAPGTPVTLSVSVTGRTPLTYQWYKGTPTAAPISGACSNSYTVLSATNRDTDRYYVSVINSDGGANSLYSYITVIYPATVALQPRNTLIPFGQPTNIFATYNSVVSVNMQWYKDGFIIPGATSSAYAITNAAMKDEGDYVFYVQNSVGGTNSVAAHVTITYPPVILSSPRSQTVNQRATVTLDVSAEGRAPMTYRWMKDSVTIVGPASRTLTIQNIQPEQAGAYTVCVSNADGIAFSGEGRITVQPVPVITQQPLTTITTVSNSLQLQVQASGIGVLTYQWQKNGANVAGANESSYSVTNAQFADAGTYAVTVANPYGSVLSEPAIVLVLPIQPIRIPKDPTQPAILQLLQIADGKRGMLFYGAVGRTYEIQATTNMVHWDVIQTNTMTYNIKEFVDQESARQQRRFYRIRLRP